MREDEFAVRVQSVSKIYHLWDSRQNRLLFPLKRLVSSFLPAKTKNNHQAMHGYREFFALQDVSFDIKKGESWGFVGVNGSGKSTLLKIISGNLPPSRGRVEVDGKVVILDYGSGFNGEFTGKENIYIKATIMGLSRKQINERYQSILDFAEIGDFINQPVRTYSSGMIARLGFAIMAHIDADIIITDEALAVGDIFFVQKCMKFIRSFLKKGTFLFVSHSMNDVLSLCQHAVWLEHGKMKAIGSAADVTSQYLETQELKKAKSKLGENDTLNYSTEKNETEKNEKDRTIVFDQPKLSELMGYQKPVIYTDMRLRYPNLSHVRNDIHVMPSEFIKESGIGGAEIINAKLMDENNNPCSCVVGSEMVTLSLDVLAKRDLKFPIIGFQVLDRLGQVLFGDNSLIITENQVFSVNAGHVFTSEFTFQMPLLPAGDFVFRVAVAQGENAGDAILLHVIENAFSLRSVTTNSRYGLIGIPMQKIVLKDKQEIKKSECAQ